MSVLIEGIDGSDSGVTVTIVGVEGKGRSDSCDAEYIGRDLAVGAIGMNGMEVEWKGDIVRLGGMNGSMTIWKNGEMVGSLNGIEVIGLDVKMVKLMEEVPVTVALY